MARTTEIELSMAPLLQAITTYYLHCPALVPCLEHILEPNTTQTVSIVLPKVGSRRQIVSFSHRIRWHQPRGHREKVMPANSTLVFPQLFQSQTSLGSATKSD